MDYQTLYAMTVTDLRKIARERGLKIPSGTTKPRLIERLLEAEDAPAPAAVTPNAEAPTEAPRRRRGRPSKAELAARAAEAEAREKAAREAEIQATRERIAREAAEQAALEKAEREAQAAKEKAEREAKEKAEREAKEKAEREAKEKAEREAKEKESAPARPIRRDMPPRGENRPNNRPRQTPEQPHRAANDANPPRPRPAAPKPQEPETRPAADAPQMADLGEGAGVLEIQPDGYGFLRAENCQQGPNDVYISIAQIRRFNLRMGDYVEGKTRPQREGDRYSAIMYITAVNGQPPEMAASRPRFDELVPIYPDERLRLEQPSTGDLSLRLVDLLAPIGKGQRGMIVSPPKAGKTTLLKNVANSLTARYPDLHLIVLLIDERPEEVTDMQRSIDGEVVYSTFDEMPENHCKVSEMVLERAQRLVEAGKDVVILMDSITRLARAYNLVIAPTGRSLSGGLDPGALFRPKRFFGAARNIENGGSLTIIATALVDTGSRMDDIIYEEFKGTGNMELHLDRKLSDRRVFPAIDMVRSGTRREELLLTPSEMEGALQLRRMLGNGRDQEMAEQIINLMARTRDNADFCNRLKGWKAVAEKDGYVFGK